MKKLFLCIPALAILAAACQKVNLTPAQEDVNEPAPAAVEMITETVSGTRGVETKATISNDTKPAFAWSIDDNVAVHVSKGETHKYVVTSSGADKAEASAKFEVTYEEGYARDAFAVYPSTIVATDAANYGQSGHTLDVKLPGSYTLAEVSGVTSPGPMISTNNAGENWEFHQLCGLLRLTVNSIPPSTTRLEIDFDGKQVWGDFSISDPTPGTSAIATKADDDHDIITITKDGSSDVTLNNNAWLDGQVLNIPLPEGTYTNITITAYNALGDAILLPVTRPFAYTADREHGTPRTASFPVFSVSSSKRVLFAPGNLQATYDATAKTWTWSFAANQFSFIGNAPGNTTISTSKKESTEPYAKLTGDGTVDLFGWSSAGTYFGIAKTTASGDYFGDFIDWGNNVIGTYATNYWRTLSKSEWNYVVGKDSPFRSGSYARGTKAIINTDGTPVKGFILFPDYYPLPTAGQKVTEGGTDIIVWGAGINSTGTSGWNTTCTTAGWNYLESEGCVFLPAAGLFYTSYTGDEGHYFSSTDVSHFRISNAGFDPTQSHNRNRRYSVRLVHEVQ